MFLLTDHLGSSDKTIDPLNNTYNNVPNVLTETRYKAWGETRYASGQPGSDYTFTGQKSEMESIGLLFYNARFYDPTLGIRAVGPDEFSIICWNV